MTLDDLLRKTVTPQLGCLSALNGYARSLLTCALEAATSAVGGAGDGRSLSTPLDATPTAKLLCSAVGLLSRPEFENCLWLAGTCLPLASPLLAALVEGMGRVSASSAVSATSPKASELLQRLTSFCGALASCSIRSLAIGEDEVSVRPWLESPLFAGGVTDQSPSSSRTPLSPPVATADATGASESKTDGTSDTSSTPATAIEVQGSTIIAWLSAHVWTPFERKFFARYDEELFQPVLAALAHHTNCTAELLAACTAFSAAGGKGKVGPEPSPLARIVAKSLYAFRKHMKLVKSRYLTMGAADADAADAAADAPDQLPNIAHGAIMVSVPRSYPELISGVVRRARALLRLRPAGVSSMPEGTRITMQRSRSSVAVSPTLAMLARDTSVVLGETIPGTPPAPPELRFRRSGSSSEGTPDGAIEVSAVPATSEADDASDAEDTFAAAAADHVEKFCGASGVVVPVDILDSILSRRQDRARWRDFGLRHLAVVVEALAGAGGELRPLVRRAVGGLRASLAGAYVRNVWPLPLTPAGGASGVGSAAAAGGAGGPGDAAADASEPASSPPAPSPPPAAGDGAQQDAPASANPTLQSAESFLVGGHGAVLHPLVHLGGAAVDTLRSVRGAFTHFLACMERLLRSAARAGDARTVHLAVWVWTWDVCDVDVDVISSTGIINTLHTLRGAAAFAEDSAVPYVAQHAVRIAAGAGFEFLVQRLTQCTSVPAISALTPMLSSADGVEAVATAALELVSRELVSWGTIARPLSESHGDFAGKESKIFRCVRLLFTLVHSRIGLAQLSSREVATHLMSLAFCPSPRVKRLSFRVLRQVLPRLRVVDVVEAFNASALADLCEGARLPGGRDAPGGQFLPWLLHVAGAPWAVAASGDATAAAALPPSVCSKGHVYGSGHATAALSCEAVSLLRVLASTDSWRRPVRQVLLRRCLPACTAVSSALNAADALRADAADAAARADGEGLGVEPAQYCDAIGGLAVLGADLGGLRVGGSVVIITDAGSEAQSGTVVQYDASQPTGKLGVIFGHTAGPNVLRLEASTVAPTSDVAPDPGLLSVADDGVADAITAALSATAPMTQDAALRQLAAAQLRSAAADALACLQQSPGAAALVVSQPALTSALLRNATSPLPVPGFVTKRSIVPHLMLLQSVLIESAAGRAGDLVETFGDREPTAPQLFRYSDAEAAARSAGVSGSEPDAGASGAAELTPQQLTRRQHARSLVEMGIGDEDTCVAALVENDDNVDRACEWILTGNLEGYLRRGGLLGVRAEEAAGKTGREAASGGVAAREPREDTTAKRQARKRSAVELSGVFGCSPVVCYHVLLRHGDAVDRASNALMEMMSVPEILVGYPTSFDESDTTAPRPRFAGSGVSDEYLFDDVREGAGRDPFAEERGQEAADADALFRPAISTEAIPASDDLAALALGSWIAVDVVRHGADEEDQRGLLAALHVGNFGGAISGSTDCAVDLLDSETGIASRAIFPARSISRVTRILSATLNSTTDARAIGATAQSCLAALSARSAASALIIAAQAAIASRSVSGGRSPRPLAFTAEARPDEGVDGSWLAADQLVRLLKLIIAPQLAGQRGDGRSAASEEPIVQHLRSRLALEDRNGSRGGTTLRETLAAECIDHLRRCTGEDGRDDAVARDREESKAGVDFGDAGGAHDRTVHVAESLHPCLTAWEQRERICVPGATEIEVCFDSRCTFPGGELQLFTSRGGVERAAHTFKNGVPEKNRVLQFEGDRVDYRFTIDRSMSGGGTAPVPGPWGFRFSVAAREDVRWLDEHKVLAKPSLQWACWLMQLLLKRDTQHSAAAAGAAAPVQAASLYSRATVSTLVDYLCTQGARGKDRIVPILAHLVAHPERSSEPADTVAIARLERVVLPKVSVAEGETGRGLVHPRVLGMLEVVAATRLVDAALRAADRGRASENVFGRQQYPPGLIDALETAQRAASSPSDGTRGWAAVSDVLDQACRDNPDVGGSAAAVMRSAVDEAGAYWTQPSLPPDAVLPALAPVAALSTALAQRTRLPDGELPPLLCCRAVLRSHVCRLV